LRHLKSLFNIEKPVQKQGTFKHGDLAQALFSSNPVLYMDKPFKKVRIPSLRDVPVTFSLDSSKITGLKDSLSILSVVIVNYNGKSISDPSVFRKLPPWILLVLMESFSKGLREWYDYTNSEMLKFCERPYSKVQWSIAKLDSRMLFSKYPLSYVQTIWVAVNSGVDKKEHYDTIRNFQEGLMPWLNLNMWREMEKKKKNTRVNTDYEEAHRKMVEEANPETNEDLDIIT
jgi:hypothetical protein